MIPAEIRLKARPNETFDARHAILEHGAVTARGQFFVWCGADWKERRYVGEPSTRTWPVGEVREIVWDDQPGLRRRGS